MKVYVASSWRNPFQPEVVQRLRAEGHEVYDFRNPPGRTGFGWRQVIEDLPPWSAEKTRDVLSHPISEGGFKSDFDAMQWADTIVMVQPSGRSAALELGWGCGAGKWTCVLLADGQEPELMLKCADILCTTFDEVLAFLAARNGVTKEPPAPRRVPSFEGEVRAILENVGDMLVEKNRAYGDSALNPVRVFSQSDPIEQINVRIDDKLSRLARGRAAGEDVVADLIGYLVLLQVAQRRAAAEAL